MVDDDPRVLESLESLLASAGHSVRLFASAEAALAPGALDGVHCLVSDIGLPGMDGLQLKQRVRSSSAPLPVILITGRAGAIEPNERHGSGYQDVFCKPFAGPSLLTSIDAALGLHPQRHRHG